MSRVLVIEDNADLAFGLRNNLEIEGYEVEVAPDGRAGLAAARAVRPDLVVLDLMLPGLDGFRVLKALREDPGPPVLILTARGEEADKVRGLKLGADDYVTKPFGLLELLARVEALLRRTRRGPARRVDKFGDDRGGRCGPCRAQAVAAPSTSPRRSWTFSSRSSRPTGRPCRGSTSCGGSGATPPRWSREPWTPTSPSSAARSRTIPRSPATC